MAFETDAVRVMALSDAKANKASVFFIVRSFPVEDKGSSRRGRSGVSVARFLAFNGRAANLAKTTPRSEGGRGHSTFSKKEKDSRLRREPMTERMRLLGSATLVTAVAPAAVTHALMTPAWMVVGPETAAVFANFEHMRFLGIDARSGQRRDGHCGSEWRRGDNAPEERGEEDWLHVHFASFHAAKMKSARALYSHCYLSRDFSVSTGSAPACPSRSHGHTC
ncbi:MAG TPA: hypothetical protein VIF34_11210 [Methylocystis sp.]|jgi:hypothetical protein